jgi:histidine triad (HIT) family protein
MSCLFCKIINGEIPCQTLYEDDLVLVFRDINPQAPDHFLTVPKKHIATAYDMQLEDKSLVGHMFWVAQKVSQDLGHQKDGCRFILNCQEGGGQTVFHLHLHTLAGKPFQEKMV